MCWEDVKIGRIKRTTQINVAVNNVTSVVLCEANKTRTGIIISPPQSGYITISLVANNTINAGINLFSGAEPLTLTVEQHGEITTRTLYAIHSAGTQTIGTFLTDLPYQE